MGLGRFNRLAGLWKGGDWGVEILDKIRRESENERVPLFLLSLDKMVQICNWQKILFAGDDSTKLN